MIELWFVSTQGTISCGAYIFANKSLSEKVNSARKLKFHTED